MKRSILVGAAATIGLLVIAVGASAATSYPSHITIVGDSGGSLSDQYIYGSVTSPKPKCVANRLVKVYKTSPSGSTLVDIARTSENGAWAAHGDFSASFGAKATVVRKTFGRPHHRKVCKSDTDTFGFI